MAKKKTPSKDNDGLEVRVTDSPNSLMGSDNDDFWQMRLKDIIETMWMPKGTNVESQNVQVNGALEALKQIAPKDGMEGMLAVQMVSTHQAAVECLRRSMIQNQTFEGRNSALKHAEKFLRLYMDQIKTLDKHRGKSDQKMVVEHVTVESGGQAIVGQVSSKPKKNDS